MKILLALVVMGSLLAACAPPPQEQLPSLPPVPMPGTSQQDI
jgi:hypothetical protein